MRRIRISLRVSSCIFFAFFLTAIIASASGQQPSRLERATAATPQTASAQEAMAERYAELPLSFEANQGQSDGQVRFLSRGTGYSFYLTKTGATLTFAPDAQGRENAFQMQLAGANGNARIHGVAELPGKSNYFFGSDSRHWFTGVPTYSKVAYENIYPGINLVYYGNQRQLEYDFVVSPGANPQQIRLSVSGAQKLAVDAEGNLVLHSSAGDVQLLAPKVYQQVHGRKQQISGQWNLLANNVAGFRLGAYDRTQALVIDPVLMYSSFLGGSQKNSLAKIAIDNAGNAYVAGYTTSGDFKTAPTPMATTFGNGTVSRGAFVAKIDPTGKSMLYSTYLSGNSDEEATGLAIDSSGNVYVAGTTHSTNFPTVNPVQAACATHNQAGTCSSAFLTKISASGSSLIFSTYLGGSGEESARGLAVDAKGSAYLLGVTSSPDFPVTAGAAQTKCAGSCQQNAFLAKFDPNGAAVNYATYLGGSGVDDVADLALDASGNVYVVGKTTSPDFPTVTPFQKSCTADSASSSGACLATAFVTKLKADGSAFAYSTYLGGSLGSQATDIAVDKLGSAYVTGSTQSPDFPVLNAYQKSCAADKVAGGCSVDAFLTKFSPTGKTLVYSTYVGGSGKDEALGIAVDANRQAYLIGRTTSPDFPTVSPTQKALKGASDAFVARFDATGTKLNFSTYHGGSATESAAGIAVDGKGSIFLAGQTSSADFPTHNAFQTSCAGTCASSFITKMAVPAASTDPNITSATSTVFTVGTAGTFTVTATGSSAITFTETGTMDTNGVITFVDNHDGTATISGTPTAGDGGANSFTITATDTAGSVNQTFTLNINENIQVTGPAGVTCDVGTACSAGYTASGFTPTPAMSVTGSLPSGVTVTDNGNATATLGGTAATGTGGVYSVNVVATNPGGSTNTGVTVTTNEAPAVLSANSTTFVVGSAGSFTVTTRGFPKPTITETGALPSGVTFTDNADGTATLAGTPAAATGGTYPISIKATNTKGTDTQSFTLQVDQAPAITSANNTTFTVGSAGTFTVTATGTPAPTFSETGALPSGVTLNSTTGVLSGTPAAGTGGTYAITLKATNTVGTATQNFTLTVDETPTITSPNNTTFAVGTAGTFTVTATGFPVPTFIITGSLPSGVTFNTTTGVLSGTPANGTGGTYPLTFKATNSVGTSAAQSFTLTVEQGPAITSGNSTTFTVGTAGTFTVTATGTPTPTLSETGALPSGVTFNTSTGVLSGTPAAGTGGTYSITFTATNSKGTANQTFTLTVDEAASITSANATTFVSGTASSFTVTTRGFPKPTLSETGALPSGVTFVDNGNGTATLSGSAALGTGGTYALTLTAHNAIGADGTQSFTLQINEAPVITSTNATTFSVGTAGTFTVTATGTPAPTLSETGALPSGVTFNTGTGVLSGTPASGSGGTYSITFTATNTVKAVNQTFTLTVNEGPTIKSTASTTFTVGTAGTFSVTTGGHPKPSLSETGALPSGITFVDNGNGTATLSGTGAAGTGGTYALTITAHNTSGPDATQSFTLTMDEAPNFTSAASTNCQVLATCTFTVTTNATAFPLPVLSETLTLPGGLTFTDNGNRTGTLTGKPAQGTGGTPGLNFRAINTAGTANQPFTLTIADFSPSVTGSPVTIIQGSSGAVELIETGQNGYASTITPSCSAGTLCNFNPATVTLPNASPNDRTQVTISTTANTVVGPHTVDITSTDANGDTHTVSSVTFNVECTYALSNPTLTPLNGTSANQFPFAFTVTATAGGSACPFTATGSGAATLQNGGTNNSITGNATGAVNFELADNNQTTPVITPMQVSFFAAPPETGTLSFNTVQEGLITQPGIIGGASSQVTLPMSNSWAAGSTVTYSPACGVVGPQGSLDATNNFGITCSVSGSSLTINTISTTSAALQRYRVGPLAPAYLFALLMPAIVLLGGTARLAPWRKRWNRSRVLTFLGLLLVAGLFVTVSGCATGGIKTAIEDSQRNQNNFTITVIGTVTDGTGAVQGIEVQTISLPVTPQI